MEYLLKKNETDYKKLNAVVEKLSEKLLQSEKSMLPDEPIEVDNDETNLDITFYNPSLETQCELCDFVAKNIRGLKIHNKSKHTKALKFKCESCNFETNNKKLNNDHKASKCSKKKFVNFVVRVLTHMRKKEFT